MLSFLKRRYTLPLFRRETRIIYPYMEMDIIGQLDMHRFVDILRKPSFSSDQYALISELYEHIRQQIAPEKNSTSLSEPENSDEDKDSGYESSSLETS